MGPALFPRAVLSCPPTEVRCMSSLDHDHLLDEGPEPRTRAGSPLAPAGGTRSRRRPAARTGEKATPSAPAPRQGEAQSRATTTTRRAGGRRQPAEGAAAPARAGAEATVVKATVAK